MEPMLRPGMLCVVKRVIPLTRVRLTRMAFGNEKSPPPHQWWGQYVDETGAVKSTREWWWLESELERVHES